MTTTTLILITIGAAVALTAMLVLLLPSGDKSAKAIVSTRSEPRRCSDLSDLAQVEDLEARLVDLRLQHEARIVAKEYAKRKLEQHRAETCAEASLLLSEEE